MTTKLAVTSFDLLRRALDGVDELRKVPYSIPTMQEIADFNRDALLPALRDVQEWAEDTIRYADELKAQATP